MNDERISAKLSIVKRNNLIIIFAVSLLFLLVKLALKIPFLSYLTELYLFAATAIVLVYTILSSSMNEIVDERVIQRTNKIYDIAFWIIALSGLLLYFITLLFYYSSSLLNGVTPNLSINTMMFICLLLSFIFVRKNKLTFNYRIIEEEKKVYYNSVLKRILYMFLYYLFVAIVVNVVKLFLVESFQSALYISIVIAVSFLTIAFQYFLFSIYEKIHYEELVEKEEGKYRYVTRKALFLFILTFSFSALYTLSIGLNNYFMINEPFSSYVSPFAAVLNVLAFYLTIVRIDFVILVLLMNILLLRSLRSIDSLNNKMLKFFKIVIILNLIYGLYTWIFGILQQFIFSIFSSEIALKILEINSFVFLVNLVVSLGISICIFIYLYNNKLKEASNFYVIRIVISILSFLLIFILNSETFESIAKYILVKNLISFVLSLISGIFIILVIRKLNRRIEYKVIKEEQVLIEEI
ncbi:MAG: hypothetical protein JEZ05_07725 [Tenericutes bacterium]|nr:hypothetical protein [Mycoplasmatota bacterium]